MCSNLCVTFLQKIIVYYIFHVLLLFRVFCEFSCHLILLYYKKNHIATAARMEITYHNDSCIIIIISFNLSGLKKSMVDDAFVLK